jgi:hypothetical protein
MVKEFVLVSESSHMIKSVLMVSHNLGYDTAPRPFSEGTGSLCIPCRHSVCHMVMMACNDTTPIYESRASSNIQRRTLVSPPILRHDPNSSVAAIFPRRIAGVVSELVGCDRAKLANDSLRVRRHR